jgi:hypothetical protein
MKNASRINEAFFIFCDIRQMRLQLYFNERLPDVIINENGAKLVKSYMNKK